MKQPHDRFDFSPIATRPVIELPGSARVGVYIVVNVERVADSDAHGLELCNIE